MWSSTKRPWPLAALIFTLFCLAMIWMGSYRPSFPHPPSVEPSSTEEWSSNTVEWSNMVQPSSVESTSAKPTSAVPSNVELNNVELSDNKTSNSTLGFEKIFFISLPQRLDRHDAISLISSITGVTPTLEPGFNGSLLQEKVKPEGSGGLRPEQLGCWRAHANVWKRMLDENIESAMVIEDDVDWDINVRDIFAEMSHQFAEQTLFPNLVPSPDAPYGRDWDLLYVGSAWDIPNNDNRPPHLLYHDPNAPTRENTGGSYIGELEGWGAKVTENTRHRLIAPSWYPVSTIGYAVTKKGAQKLLYNLGGYKGLNAPVDLAMIGLLQKGIVDSYTIIPPIITRYRTGGSRDSDIDEVKPEDAEAKTGSENLNMGARKAMEKLQEKSPH